MHLRASSSAVYGPKMKIRVAVGTMAASETRLPGPRDLASFICFSISRADGPQAPRASVAAHNRSRPFIARSSQASTRRTRVSLQGITAASRLCCTILRYITHADLVRRLVNSLLDHTMRVRSGLRQRALCCRAWPLSPYSASSRRESEDTGVVRSATLRTNTSHGHRARTPHRGRQLHAGLGQAPEHGTGDRVARRAGQPPDETGIAGYRRAHRTAAGGAMGSGRVW